jgi:hypothetical protein
MELKRNKMGKFDALFEDEDGLFGGTPRSKYWDIFNQVSTDLAQEEFDITLAKMAAMERMLMEQIHEEELNRRVEQYILENGMAVDQQKESLYMELAGRLIYRLSD